MKYKYIAIFCSCLFSYLFAQQLHLPTEDIVGNVTDTPDSLQISVDYTEHYNFDDLERLTYRPFLTQEIDRNARKQNGFLFVKWNSNPLYDIDFGIYSNSKPALNLYGTYHQSNIDDHETQKIKLQWKPIKDFTSFRIRPEIFYKDNIYEKESKKDSLIVSSERQMIGWSIATYSPNFFSLRSLRMAGVHPVAQAPIYPPEVRRDYFEHSNSPEFDINMHFADILFTTESKFNWYYRHQRGHLASNIHIPSSFTDILALNLQYSDNLLPSILVEKSFYVNEHVDVAVSNFPYMNAKSLDDYIDTFPFATTEQIDRECVERVPLNLFVSFNLYNPIELRAYLNSVYTMNYHYVDRDDTAQHYWTNAKYALVTSTNLEAEKKINDFSLSLLLKYILHTQIKDLDNLPYEPYLQITPAATYSYKKLTSKLTGSLLYSRHDSDGKKWDGSSAFILSNENTIDINRHFKMSINLHNITNQDYHKIKGAPAETFNAEIGVRWLF